MSAEIPTAEERKAEIERMAREAFITNAGHSYVHDGRAQAEDLVRQATVAYDTIHKTVWDKRLLTATVNGQAFGVYPTEEDLTKADVTIEYILSTVGLLQDHELRRNKTDQEWCLGDIVDVHQGDKFVTVYVGPAGKTST